MLYYQYKNLSPSLQKTCKIRNNNLRHILFFSVDWLLFTLVLFFSIAANAQSTDDLMVMNLHQLLDLTVESASGLEETMRDAPAALVVISAEQIQERGYTSLDEIFDDLPGFDVIRSHGTQQMIAYQRGYRTPFMQRTLFMVDGLVENHLWTQAAIISRQYPLSAIERIEVLYGPTSAVYGPNAFLGIVNVITTSGKKEQDGEHHGSLQAMIGSYTSRTVEGHARGRQGEFWYNLTGKIFRDNGPGLEDYAPWGYLSENWLNNREVWGAVLDQTNEGVQYGQLYDPTRDWGVFGRAGYRNWTLGVMAWETEEGYGAFYAADRVQPNAFWKHAGQQVYVEHQAKRETVQVKTFAGYHYNRLWGDWVEASADWNEGQEMKSYLSFSDWNSQNHSWLFKQDYDWSINSIWRLTGGIKYEAKTLTKAYDLCSYWSGTFCSSAIPGDEGPYNLGAGVFHSTDPEVVRAAGPVFHMPAENLEHTRDWGVYTQLIRDYQAWRLLAGLRYDRNNLYGGTYNPRASAIYRYSQHTVFKWLYGRAFQEASPIQLWGGWIGREGNPDLAPEKAENIEFIFMHQQGRWLHDVSLFRAHYRDVLKEEAENAGSRTVWGLEYRGRFTLPNILAHQPDIQGYLYYTYTRSRSSITYDHNLADWVDGEADLGDIAPHKINAGITWPITGQWSLNLRANYVSTRKLYLRNPLREQGESISSFSVFHLNARYHDGPFSASLGVRNLLDAEYYVPGLEQADSGNDFTQRSAGFRNSLIAQTGRSWWLTGQWQF